MSGIVIEKVRKSFDTKDGVVEALKDVNLNIDSGDIYGIIGMSGAGKSTLVRCMNFLEVPTEGQVLIDGKALGDLTEKELRKQREEIGMIFQHFNLMPSRTVFGNVAYPLRGSGLSSSAAFEMGMACIWNGEYACGLDARALAGICQYAENTYFGKPSGQLDQLASAVGGVIFADFADPAAPQVEKIHADGLLPPGMTLCVTDTRGSHSELTGEFAAIRNEMEAVAACLGGKVLGEVDEKRFWQELPRLREQCGDRAVLRAIHYFEENARTLAQRDALVAGDFAAFARLVEKSGHSSFECCQNVYCASSPKHQGLSAALAISQSILAGTGGAWRMQGGGFAGTIQAFVPDALIKRYCVAMEALFGPGCCYLLSLREQGTVRVM